MLTPLVFLKKKVVAIRSMLRIPKKISWYHKHNNMKLSKDDHHSERLLDKLTALESSKNLKITCL